MNIDEKSYVLEWLINNGVTDVSCSANPEAINKRCKAGFEDISTLDDLKNALSFVCVDMKKYATNMVFGCGNVNAEILLLGEAPGAEEDRLGLPFVGQSGQLLDKILLSVGLSRETVYITNILPWRPPGNRTPNNQEIALFRPYALKHIQIINPKIVVCLGGTATKALLQTSSGIVQLRGKWTKIEEINADVMPTFHPAYLLRSPSQKREVWIDFLKIKEKCSALKI